MNIKNRIQKLEATLPDADACQCTDATAYAGTEYFKTCDQCGKNIDLDTWKGWNLTLPSDEENHFAFALERIGE